MNVDYIEYGEESLSFKPSRQSPILLCIREPCVEPREFLKKQQQFSHQFSRTLTCAIPRVIIHSRKQWKEKRKAKKSSFVLGFQGFLRWRSYVGVNRIWRCVLFRDQFQRSIGLRYSYFGKCRASQNRLHFWPPYRGGDQLRGKPHGFGHTGRKTSHLW